MKSAPSICSKHYTSFLFFKTFKIIIYDRCCISSGVPFSKCPARCTVLAIHYFAITIVCIRK